MTPAEMAIAAAGPHRRREDQGWPARFGLATRSVLPPLFAICGLIVFLYHGLGVHALLVHGKVAQATEEPGTIDLLIYLSSVAAAFGAKHFDALAVAIANRISLVKMDTTQKTTVDTTVRAFNAERGFEPTP